MARDCRDVDIDGFGFEHEQGYTIAVTQPVLRLLHTEAAMICSNNRFRWPNTYNVNSFRSPHPSSRTVRAPAGRDNVSSFAPVHSRSGMTHRQCGTSTKAGGRGWTRRPWMCFDMVGAPSSTLGQGGCKTSRQVRCYPTPRQQLAELSALDPHKHLALTASITS